MTLPGNYISNTTASTSANITARPITVTASSDSKTYDGTTSSSGTPTVTTGSLATGDTGSFSQTFDTKNVGTGKTLTPSGSVSDGNSGDNYTVTFANSTNGTITARPITVTAATDSKTYDGTTSSSGTPTVTTGSLATGDTGNFSQVFDTKNVGTGKTLTPSGSVSDGNSGNNYTVTFANNTTGKITAKQLTASFTAANKIYDGNNSATITGSSITGGVVSGETVGISHATATATFNDASVGTGKTVTGTGFTLTGADAGNYSLPASLTTTASITPWNLNGFYQPIDMGETVNTVKNGSTVPVKFELFSGTTELTSTSAVSSISVRAVSCALFNGDPTDEIEYLAPTGGTSLRYDSTGGQFIYNWATPKKPNTCYNLTMTAADGSPLTAYFKLR